MAKPASIDAYLKLLSADKRAPLEKLRRMIKEAAPGAEERISYGLPAFRTQGELVAGFGARAHHCSFYPMSGSVTAALKKELKDYETSKGAIRFPVGKPLPAARWIGNDAVKDLKSAATKKRLASHRSKT